MKKYTFLLALVFAAAVSQAQHIGIVRENYISSYYDSTLMLNIDLLDSSTIRLGSICRYRDWETDRKSVV